MTRRRYTLTLPPLPAASRRDPVHFVVGRQLRTTSCVMPMLISRPAWRPACVADVVRFPAPRRWDPHPFSFPAGSFRSPGDPCPGRPTPWLDGIETMVCSFANANGFTHRRLPRTRWAQLRATGANKRLPRTGDPRLETGNLRGATPHGVLWCGGGWQPPNAFPERKNIGEAARHHRCRAK